MEWKQFKNEKPEDDSRLLICGVINTDPLRCCTNYMYMEFVDYRKGLIASDSETLDDCEPDPEDYWVYQNDIPTPFEKE